MIFLPIISAANQKRKKFVVPVQTVPTWLQGKSLLTWYQLSGSAMSSAMGSYSSPGGVKQGIMAYSGLAWSSNRLWSIGNGGHSDYAGNEAIEIDFTQNAPAWALLRAPTATVQIDVSHYSDGRPSSAHSGHALQYIAARNRVFRFGAGNTWGNGNGSNTIDAFNLATNDWDTAGTYSTSGIGFQNDNVCRAMCRDAQDNVWMMRTDTGDIHKWTESTATLSTVATRSGYSYGVPWEYDPIRNRIVRFHTSQGARYDTTSAAETTVTFTGATAGVQRYLTARWNPDRETFLTMPWQSNAPAVYEVDPATFAVSSLSIAGTAPPAASDDGYGWLPGGRFGYLSQFKVMVYVRSYSDNVWFFRTA